MLFTHVFEITHVGTVYFFLEQVSRKSVLSSKLMTLTYQFCSVAEGLAAKFAVCSH